MPRIDPILGYNFLISLVDSSSSSVPTASGAPADLDRAPQGGFSECSGLEARLDVEEYKEGGNNGAVLRFPTRASWSNIRLRRGIVRSNVLWTWYYGFVEGKGKRKDGLIVLQDERHQPIKVWQFVRGLPVKWTGPTLNATQNQVAVEELEIAHEGLKLLPTSLSVTLEQIGEAASNVASAVGGLF